MKLLILKTIHIIYLRQIKGNNIMKKLLIFTIVLLVISLVGCNNVSVTSSETDTISSQTELISSENVSSSVEETSSEETVSNEQSLESITEPEASENSSTVEIPSSQTENSITINGAKEETNISKETSNNVEENKHLMHAGYSIDPETGEKIEGSDEYYDSEGNVYNENGEFLYNLNEWGDFYYGEIP